MVGGVEVDGFSSWGVSMTTFGYEDVASCERSGYESGGGGGGGDDDGGGGGDGGGCQNPKLSKKIKIFKFTNINIKCSLTNHYLVIC